MPEILENAEEDLTPRMRNLLALLWNEWRNLERQVVDLNHEVHVTSKPETLFLHEVLDRLWTVA